MKTIRASKYCAFRGNTHNNDLCKFYIVCIESSDNEKSVKIIKRILSKEDLTKYGLKLRKKSKCGNLYDDDIILKETTFLNIAYHGTNLINS